MKTKELNELIDGAMLLTICILRELSDGVHIHDAIAIFAKIQSNQKLREAMVKAAAGATKIPAELKDIGLRESCELTAKILQYIPEMIDAVTANKKLSVF